MSFLSNGMVSKSQTFVAWLMCSLASCAYTVSSLVVRRSLIIVEEDANTFAVVHSPDSLSEDVTN